MGFRVQFYGRVEVLGNKKGYIGALGHRLEVLKLDRDGCILIYNTFLLG